MSRNGGLPARRAIVRWALRLFRREWRQQSAVLTLLAVAVTAAVLAVSAGYHAAPPAGAAFGTARQSLTLRATGDRPLDVQVAQARDWFGAVDVIGHTDLPIPGSVDTVQLRRQDPHGRYGAPMLHLRDGRYPAEPGEAAVTVDVAARLQTRIGGRLTLDGRSWTVVGTVENPGDLRARFILDAPSSSIPPQSVTVLVDAPADRFDQFRAEHGHPAYALRPSLVWAEAAAGVFSVFTVGMLLICLIAAAGFAVVAHRRQRQLGLLAAIGATPRHLRLVLLAHGATVGAAAAVLGTPLGVLAWFAVAPRFETAAGHRIGALDLPWVQITVAVLLTIVAATAAAWRPAHTAARLPVTLALSERPPRPSRVRRSAAAAGGFVLLGVVALRLVQSNRPTDGDALEIGDVALVVTGTLAIGFALLSIGPAAIRTLAATAARLPVAARLALRDLARHQARSSAALAAISVALAIPAAIVIGARALEPDPATGNLSDRQVLLRLDSPGPRVPDRDPARIEAIEARVRQWTASLGDPVVIPLDVAIDPGETPSTDAPDVPAGRTAAGAASGSPAVVITPELLRLYGVDPTGVDPAADVLTSAPAPGGSWPPGTVTRPLPEPGFRSLPHTLLTPAALQRNGWIPVRTGWLVETAEPLTGRQLAGAAEFAGAAGLTVEERDQGDDLQALRAITTAAGALLALVILAVTVGLIRAEAAGDLRTLTAVGATRHIRRALTSATAGGLALLGALLGIGAAYTVILAGSSAEQLRELARVPLADLTVIAVGVPLAAAALGWLLAGREPRSLARVRLE
ncbi:hypothetical protein Aph02nite_84800 [Actinoplanes philippinensis]|uniref:Putative ABC transport system permease protein n=1 Tax=Actinoplanes philippinensis TaxID=35752 RepID=A0A1I2ENA8_9ACTN|nr:FtsX-like permease family protein [Actinoplanes philippinensis]GIE82530.1 hypothetical protein Aph02nite_84800 [Actinoplanes philippinensis]SFE94512.1 putative ABC transport system permease protein [Actinoplanes philippinensis]